MPNASSAAIAALPALLVRATYEKLDGADHGTTSALCANEADGKSTARIAAIETVRTIVKHGLASVALDEGQPESVVRTEVRPYFCCCDPTGFSTVRSCESTEYSVNGWYISSQLCSDQNTSRCGPGFHLLRIELS